MSDPERELAALDRMLADVTDEADRAISAYEGAAKAHDRAEERLAALLRSLRALRRFHWHSGMTTDAMTGGPHWFESPTGEMVKWRELADLLAPYGEP